MAKLAPAFGVVGTLIESIKMMLGLSATDPKKMLDGVSTNMAAALLTTFYGVILSNLIFSPISLKVEKRIEERIILMDIIMEGTLLILEKTPPALVHDQLKAFLLLLK